jgi:hypothetical protein
MSKDKSHIKQLMNIKQRPQELKIFNYFGKKLLHFISQMKTDSYLISQWCQIKWIELGLDLDEKISDN